MNEPHDVCLIFEDKFVQIRISLFLTLRILHRMLQIYSLLFAIFSLYGNLKCIVFIFLFLSPQRLFSAILVILTICCWLWSHAQTSLIRGSSPLRFCLSQLNLAVVRFKQIIYVRKLGRGISAVIWRFGDQKLRTSLFLSGFWAAISLFYSTCLSWTCRAIVRVLIQRLLHTNFGSEPRTHLQLIVKHFSF